jgi:hypothetical protein
MVYAQLWEGVNLMIPFNTTESSSRPVLYAAINGMVVTQFINQHIDTIHSLTVRDLIAAMYALKLLSADDCVRAFLDGTLHVVYDTSLTEAQFQLADYICVPA